MSEEKILKDIENSEEGILNRYKIEVPSAMQDFEGSEIDLTSNPEMYNSFLRSIKDIKHPETKQTFAQAVKEAEASILFNESEDEDKKVIVESIVDDYETLAKNELKNEYPVIDQLILEDKLKQEQTGGF
jgi:hypothetical protein